MPKQDLAAIRTALSAAFGTASVGTAPTGTTERGAVQDTGPAPVTRRPPLRELPRTGRGGARHRIQAPRRTY